MSCQGVSISPSDESTDASNRKFSFSGHYGAVLDIKEEVLRPTAILMEIRGVDCSDDRFVCKNFDPLFFLFPKCDTKIKRDTYTIGTEYEVEIGSIFGDSPFGEVNGLMVLRVQKHDEYGSGNILFYSKIRGLLGFAANSAIKGKVIDVSSDDVDWTSVSLLDGYDGPYSCEF